MRSIWFVALAAIAVPAIAQETEAPKPEKKICRMMSATGSIMGKRECHTKAEWDAMAERSKNDRERLDRSMRARDGGVGVNRNP